MPIFIDQLSRKLDIPSTPKRIISLVPSQSEFLWDIGLRNELIGITKFCIHPDEMFQNKTRIGGTKEINFEKIAELKPDLIIGNKEENEQEQILELMKHYPVWMSDVNDLKSAYEMMVSLGELVGKREKAGEIKLTIEYQFNTFIKENKKPTTVDRRLKIAYLIWQNPIMVAGKNTFIDHLLNVCGFENTFSDSRYPEVTMNDLIEKKPDLIFLSSEPYPFKEKHILEFSQKIPNAKTILVDGEMFSWYGSRLLKAPNYFRGLLNKIS